MTPEKLKELADRIDEHQLWRLSWLNQQKLAPDQKDKLDAGVNLRRYADSFVKNYLGRYRHYKGGIYNVLCVAEDTNTAQLMIVYKSESINNIYVRPAEEFLGTVIVDKTLVQRFKFLDGESVCVGN